MSSGASSRTAAAARRFRLATAGIFLAVAVAVAALSAVPYESVKEHVDRFAVDEDAGVTRTSFDSLVLRARLTAAGFAAMSAVLLLLGSRLDPPLAAVLRGWSRSLRTAPERLHRWIARHPVDAVVLALLTTVALALRATFLDVPLRYDEATTYVNYVSKPLYVGLSNYSEPNNHLLHTALAKVSVTLFGNGETALRLPALLAGVALVPATFVLGRALYGRAAGFIAAGLVASSSTLVEYSANARGYTIVALLTVVGFLAATRVVGDGSLPAWALLAVTLALGLYAVPVMIYPAGGIVVWIAASRFAAHRPFRPLLRSLLVLALATAGLAALLYAPVFLASGPRSVTSNEFVTPRSWSDFVGQLPAHAADTAATWVRDLPFGVAVGAGLILSASVALTPHLSRYSIPPLLAVATWSLPLLVAQRVVPFTRVWIFAFPLAAVAVGGMLAWAAERLGRTRSVAIAAAAAIAAGGSWAVLASDSPRMSRETGGLLDAPAIAGYLAPVVTPTDRILATGSDTILQYYLDEQGIDSAPLLYTSEPRRRVFVLVNELGDQTVRLLLDELGDARATYGPPRLLRRWPSASAYVLERRADAPPA